MWGQLDDIEFNGFFTPGVDKVEKNSASATTKHYILGGNAIVETTGNGSAEHSFSLLLTAETTENIEEIRAKIDAMREAGTPVFFAIGSEIIDEIIILSISEKLQYNHIGVIIRAELNIKAERAE